MTHQLINTGAGWRCLRCKAAWDQGDEAPETCVASDEHGFVTDMPAKGSFAAAGVDMTSEQAAYLEQDGFSVAPAEEIVAVEWRAIPGWPDYEASSHGEIRSWKPARNCAPKPTEGRVLTTRPDKDGYRSVALYDPVDGLWHTKAHILVCMAFRGPKPSPDHVVRHLDGTRDNNHWTNLIWGTPAQNSADSRKHGTWSHGAKVNTAKLTESEVIEILGRPDETHKVLAEEYGVSTGAIWHIRDGRTWKHLHDSGAEEVQNIDPMKRQVRGTHYRSLAIQPTEFCMRNGLDFCVGSILKYLTRWRSKNGREDLLKAKHFVEIREAFPHDIHPPRQIAITMLEYVTRNNIRPDDAEALYRLEAYYNAPGHHARIGADRLMLEIDRLADRAALT